MSRGCGKDGQVFGGRRINWNGIERAGGRIGSVVRYYSKEEWD
jgi:hypothetical protein